MTEQELLTRQLAPSYYKFEFPTDSLTIKELLSEHNLLIYTMHSDADKVVLISEQTLSEYLLDHSSGGYSVLYLCEKENNFKNGVQPVLLKIGSLNTIIK